MNCCCENYIDLGCFDVCEDIQTGILATEDGTYRLSYQFLNLKINKDVILSIGDEITIPNLYLNENADFELKIKAPSGWLSTCYTFKTKPCLNL